MCVADASPLMAPRGLLCELLDGHPIGTAELAASVTHCVQLAAGMCEIHPADPWYVTLSVWSLNVIAATVLTDPIAAALTTHESGNTIEATSLIADHEDHTHIEAAEQAPIETSVPVNVQAVAFDDDGWWATKGRMRSIRNP